MKKSIALLLALVMTLSLLVACNSNGGNKTNVNEKLFTKPTEEVTLDVWYAVSGITATTFEALVNEYIAANPNIKINISYAGSYADCAEKISANLLTGTAPDVALISAAPLYTGARGDYLIETLIEDPEFDKDDVENYVRKSGARVIQRKGATFYAVSISVCHLVKSLLGGIDTTLTVSTMLHGEYGIDDVCLSLLNVVGNKGAHSKILLPLKDSEIAQLHKSAESLKEVIRSVQI